MISRIRGQIFRQTQPSFHVFLKHCTPTSKVKVAHFMDISMFCRREVAMRQNCLHGAIPVEI
jgi:hypothetical protein